MASIQTAIELQDNFTSVIYGIINATSTAVSSFDEMAQAMNANIDTGSLEDARDEVNQVTAAVEELNEALNNQTAPDIAPATIPDETSQVINTDVNPVLPDPLVENPDPVPLPVQPNAPPDPVEVPVTWQTDNLDIFTSSGIERFEQEVQSANSMLNTLNTTQAQIEQTANSINILPSNAVTDINSLGQRLQAVQSRIEQISSNQLNVGTDEANAGLEEMRSQLSYALSAQEELNAALDAMDVQAANNAYLRLSQTVASTERYIRDNTNEQGQFNSTIQQGVNHASNLNSVISKAVTAFAGLFGVRKIFSFMTDSMELFDTQLNAETQLMSVLANMLDDDYVSDYLMDVQVDADTTDAINEINAIQSNVDDVVITVDARTDALQAEFDAITAKASEIQSNGIYGDEAMIAGAAELSTYFTDPEAITMMMDTLADYAMGMSGGGEIDSTTMVDYATNLGKIMSGAYDAMTKKGFEFTEAQEAIIEGVATEEQIVEALGEEYLDMSSDMQAAAAITQVIDESWAGLYETMSNTPEGQIIQLKNSWGDLKEVIGGQLYPAVLDFLNVFTNNWDTIESFVSGFAEGLYVIIEILATLIEYAMMFGEFISTNWSVISPIVYGIATALALYATYLGIVRAAEMIGTAVKTALVVAEYAHAAATGTAVAATTAETAAQMGLNTALLSCPLTWIILLIVALIAVVIAVANYIANLGGTATTAFGVITGGVNVVIQFFKNLGLSIANIALGIGNAIAALGSNIMTAFHNAICSVQAWWYDLLSTCLSVIESICAALNKLPFVEFDYSGITSAADDYAAKAAEAANNKEDYTSISDAFNEGYSTFDTFQDGWVSDAYAAGAAWGDGISDSVSSAFSMDDYGAADYSVSASDYSSALNNSGIGSDLSDIAGSTGSIADSMDITEEELKYLRDIAEQEAINRFTTAEIKIDAPITNQISNDMDLDGVVSGLTDAVNEAVDIMTEGVHD